MQESAVWQFSLDTFHAAGWGGSLLLALVVFWRHGKLRTLVVATTIVTLALVMLGAYVRLTDAGLGCPDWPGCYGKLSPRHAVAEILAAEAAAPAGPVSVPKAWNEMLHRYLASLVGVMILAIAFRTLRLRLRGDRDQHPARRSVCRWRWWRWWSCRACSGSGRLRFYSNR